MSYWDGSGVNDTEREEHRECDGTLYSPPAGGRDPFESPCEFKGIVDVTYTGKEGFWECPACDTYHEVTLD